MQFILKWCTAGNRISFYVYEGQQVCWSWIRAVRNLLFFHASLRQSNFLHIFLPSLPIHEEYEFPFFKNEIFSFFWTEKTFYSWDWFRKKKSVFRTIGISSQSKRVEGVNKILQMDPLIYSDIRDNFLWGKLRYRGAMPPPHLGISILRIEGKMRKYFHAVREYFYDNYYLINAKNTCAA